LKQLLLSYTRYNHWANERLLSIVSSQITEEQLDLEVISSFKSLRKTIFHIWDAETIWLKRLNGEDVTDWPSKSFSGTTAEMITGLLDNNKALITFVETCGDQFLKTQFEYHAIDGTAYKNVVGDAIQHCVNHSTFHRGQIVTLLRQLGLTKLAATDYIAYCRSL
jgi:uncharacterized damage-inducible protein DinB